MIPTKQDKVAAALLHSLADAIEEEATTQAGESSHPALLTACEAMIRDVGEMRREAFALVHGTACESGYGAGNP